MTAPRALAAKIYRRYHPRPDPLTAPVSRLPATAEAYRSVDTTLLFDRVILQAQPKAVVVIVPNVRMGLSAGPMTGLRFAVALAVELGLPIRVVTTDRWNPGTNAEAETSIGQRLGVPNVAIDHVGLGGTTTCSPDDVWVATAWSTAYSAMVAARCGILNPRQVVYLVQDYEAAFHPWSSEWAAVRTTYHAGFHHVVNSRPLAEFLRDQEGQIVDDARVMAPDLDLDRLAQVAARRRSDTAEVFFYARPAGMAPRNMFPLGLAAARRAAQLTTRPWRLVLAGQPMDAPTVAGVDVECLGQTSPHGYFDLMARTNVALSLMMSPHPSHPPLDWAVSGGWAVTNRFGRYHDDLHPRLLTAEPDVEALGALLAHTIDTAEPGEFVAPATLGRPMADVIASVAEELT